MPDHDDLDAPDAALVAAVVDDQSAPFDLDGLARETGATRTLLEALERAGLLLAHHVDEGGTARYSAADAAAVSAGLRLLDAGLPLGELLDLARRTDEAVSDVAEHAVEAFLRFVRDPVRGTASSDEEATDRLLTAYHQMLPATERLVAHHLRRRLLATATARVAEEQADDEAGS
jgi:DNA-binding transcriptional MerR regulator